MDETVQLSYLQWQEKYNFEKPYQVFQPLPKGVPEESATNLEFGFGDTEIIRDIRDATTTFSLDESGFTTAKLDICPRLFSEPDIDKQYVPACCELVKRVVKANRVIPFDWRIRKSVSPVTSDVVNLKDNMIPLLPARHVHVDQTPSSAVKRVELHAPEELHRLKTGRIMLINVWKPLNPIVEDWPLAVCDAASVSPEDLIAVDHVRTKNVGESSYLLYRPTHRWWYLSQQKRDEVILLKIYDSSKAGGGGCPHTSFFRPHGASDAEPRESIEVRLLVFL